MKTAAIIVAGGQGKRLGFPSPKQFALLAGRPLIDYSIERFLSLRVNYIIAVLISGYQKYYQPHPAISAIALGGGQRQESVYNGLRACPAETEIVLIHDAARPFFPLAGIKKALKTIEKMELDGLAPAIASADTLVEVNNGQIIYFPPRHNIFRTQTPQIFSYEKILMAYKKAEKNLNAAHFTDDLSLAFAAGLRCGLFEGSQTNLKITDELDWALAEQLIKSGRLDSNKEQNHLKR